MRELIDSVITPDDWRAMIRALMEAGKAGDLRAFQALAGYRFGTPTREAPTADDDKVQIVLAEIEGERRGAGKQ